MIRKYHSISVSVAKTTALGSKMAEPPPKRQRIADVGDSPRPSPTSLTRPISPPMMRRSAVPRPQKEQSCKVIPSPFRLTKIRDSPASNDNGGAVGLHDLLGDPLIKECWEFNFLHDIDYLMSHFDQDVRSLVKVHLVHGFWKREDPNKIMLEVRISVVPSITCLGTYWQGLALLFGLCRTYHSLSFTHARNSHNFWSDTVQLDIQSI